MHGKKPSKFITFILSIIPGVGHLYLGAMNRGLQFLILFFSSVFLLDFLSFRIIPFWLPIVWFYGLFDALQLADQAILYAEVQDKPLVEWSHIKVKQHWLGWGLLGLGVLLLMDNVLPRIWNALFSHIHWFSFRPLLTALLLIGAGIYLLRGKKVQNHDGQ
jgi:hypothetical protein